MGIMDLFRRKAKAEQKGLPASIAYGTGRVVAGVTDDLANSALWSCVINLSRLYATLPWHAYSGTGNSRRQLTSGILPALLKKPNPFMTSYEFRFFMGFNFEMHGESVAIIQRARNGLPIALWPVSPGALVMSEENGRLYYTVAITGTRYPAEDILLVRNTPVGYGGGSVLSPVAYASDDIDLSDKCRKMQAEYYSSATVMGNIIHVPQGFTDAQKDKVREQFTNGRYRNYVLDERVKLQPIQIQGADTSRLNEAQKWSVSEVCRRFGVPPFFVGDMTGTYNNAEQQGLQMVTYTLQPRIGAWESALEDAICQEGQYVRFSLDGLMRGDHAARASFYHNAIMDGWMTINEVRGFEDMLGIGADGDVHLFPTNYGTLPDIIAGKYQSANNAGSFWNLPPDDDGGQEKEPENPTPEPKPEPTPETREEKEESVRKALREAKRRVDLLFVEKSHAPAKSNRQRLEAAIRSQLKDAIAQLKTLVATGQPTQSVVEDFKAWLDEHATSDTARYSAICLDVLQKMVPVVQKETGKDKTPGEADMQRYSDTFADGLAKRVSGTVLRTAKASLGTDTFDDDMAALERDYPVDQSDEEVNRSSNAFNVWLFANLGVTVFHVVAASNCCSFCSSVDGKVASVEGYVLRGGDDMDMGDGSVRHIDKDYRHPPFHAHCRCSVAPGE